MNLGPAKNMSKKPLFEEKIRGLGMFLELRECKAPSRARYQATPYSDVHNYYSITEKRLFEKPRFCFFNVYRNEEFFR